MKTFGFIFEQMCIRDLKAYTYGFFSSIGYYRDRYGLEADIVLHLDDGRYVLIECKLGSREIEEGANHLTRLHNLISEHNRNEKQMPIAEPDLKIILTGGQYGYTRKDGVHVIPPALPSPIREGPEPTVHTVVRQTAAGRGQDTYASDCHPKPTERTVLKYENVSGV